MARRKGGRDVSTPSLGPRPAPAFLSTPLRVQSALSLLEDLRFWRPDAYTYSPRAFQSSSARVQVKKDPTRPGFISPGLFYAKPTEVGVCIRRSRRRAVLFSRNIAGGSVNKFRRRRPARFAGVSCGR